MWNPCSSNPQGQIKLWVDILTPAEAQRSPPENIAPPLPVQYEMRVTGNAHGHSLISLGNYLGNKRCGL